jgi:hypothetical protein
VDGLPSIEDHQAVRAVRARHAALRDQFDAAKREREAIGKTLGLKPGVHSPGRVERLAAELLAAGQSTESIDRFESVCNAERRLAEAVTIAAREVEPAIDAARREYQPVVNREVMDPKRRELALAWVALIRLHDSYRRTVDRVRGAGFEPGGGLFADAAPMPDIGRPMDDMRRLVAAGILTADEAAGLI